MLRGLNELIYSKCLKQILAQNKLLINVSFHNGDKMIIIKERVTVMGTILLLTKIKTKSGALLGDLR